MSVSLVWDLNTMRGKKYPQPFSCQTGETKLLASNVERTQFFHLGVQEWKGWGLKLSLADQWRGAVPSWAFPPRLVLSWLISSWGFPHVSQSRSYPLISNGKSVRRKMWGSAYAKYLVMHISKHSSCKRGKMLTCLRSATLPCAFQVSAKKQRFKLLKLTHYLQKSTLQPEYLFLESYQITRNRLKNVRNIQTP